MVRILGRKHGAVADEYHTAVCVQNSTVSFSAGLQFSAVKIGWHESTATTVHYLRSSGSHFSASIVVWQGTALITDLRLLVGIASTYLGPAKQGRRVI